MILSMRFQARKCVISTERMSKSTTLAQKRFNYKLEVPSHDDIKVETIIRADFEPTCLAVEDGFVGIVGSNSELIIKHLPLQS